MHERKVITGRRMRRARSATQAIGSHLINNEGNINLRIPKKDKPNFQQGSRRAYGTAVSRVVIHLVHRPMSL